MYSIQNPCFNYSGNFITFGVNEPRKNMKVTFYEAHITDKIHELQTISEIGNIPLTKIPFILKMYQPKQSYFT